MTDTVPTAPPTPLPNNKSEKTVLATAELLIAIISRVGALIIFVSVLFGLLNGYDSVDKSGMQTGDDMAALIIGVLVPFALAGTWLLVTDFIIRYRTLRKLAAPTLGKTLLIYYVALFFITRFLPLPKFNFQAGSTAKQPTAGEITQTLIISIILTSIISYCLMLFLYRRSRRQEA